MRDGQKRCICNPLLKKSPMNLSSEAAFKATLFNFLQFSLSFYAYLSLLT